MSAAAGLPCFDSHGHLNSSRFDEDRAAAVERMRRAGLVGGLVVGCEESEIGDVLALVRSSPGYLHGAWALHPEYEPGDPRRPEVSVRRVIEVCSAPEMVAVGETGLDYHWCHGDLSWQKERFRRHIAAALELGKPLIVHAREAEDDALDILIAARADRVGFVLHCFGGSLECARRAVDYGGLISFTGVVTFNNAGALREVVAALPLGSMMLETDCPYMAPVPFRGRRCEPAMVTEVARAVAAIKGTSPEEVARVTTATAREFFNIPAGDGAAGPSAPPA